MNEPFPDADPEYAELKAHYEGEPPEYVAGPRKGPISLLHIDASVYDMLISKGYDTTRLFRMNSYFVSQFFDTSQLEALIENLKDIRKNLKDPNQKWWGSYGTVGANVDVLIKFVTLSRDYSVDFNKRIEFVIV